MFISSLKSALVAGSVALGALAATSGTASAGGKIGVYLDGPHFSIGFGDYRDRRHRDWRDHRDWRRPYFRKCSPRKALRKAKRRGLRRAHIIRVGHRGVVVGGRKWGEYVKIGFGRHRSCPVHFVRSRY